MIHNNPETCLHLHIICTECDFSEGHCHCNDGGDWFCKDCNSMEYQPSKNSLVKIYDAIELRNPYTWYQHDRKTKSNLCKGE